MDKKILTFLLGSLVAFGVQASKVSWQFTNLAIGDDSAKAQDLRGYTAYLLLQGDFNEADVDSSISHALTGVASDKWTDCVFDPPARTAFNLEVSHVKNLSLPENTTTNCYIVFSNGDNYWRSELIGGVTVRPDEGVPYPGYKIAQLFLKNGDAIKTTDVRPIVAPEPTSALLLMLGLAGLALRRKVA